MNVLSALLIAAAAAGSTPDAAEAVARYDEGKYAEACEILRHLDANGATDGPLLYRLFFCERSTGNEGAAQKALDRARQALEADNAAGAPLEIPFYLANAYANMGRGADARKVAEAATRSIESGTRKEPAGLIEAFQVGKLYQDQGRQEEALRWYAKAIAAFDPASPKYAGSVRWALRYTASVAASRSDFAGTETALMKLTELGDAGAADWSGLAIARARLKKYEQASDAWREAVRLDPASGDDPRYAGRVALVASRLPPLPTTATDGKAFASMSPAELEASMKASAEAAREIHAKAAAAMQPDLDPALRTSLTMELAAIQGRFFAAALEYAVRRQPIRETAFREGYAVFIFQDTEWEIPGPPPK